MLHLKIIFRSWRRNGLSTLISLLSLTVGLICSTMLIMFVVGEYKVASALGRTDRVYMLEKMDSFYNKDKNVRDASLSPTVVIKLAESYGDIDAYCLAHQSEWRLNDAIKRYAKKGLYMVTDNFCDMFDIPVLEGDLRATLKSKSEIAVSESFMQEVFGRSAKIGDRITAKSGGNAYFNNVRSAIIDHDVVITTILDETHKTPFSYGALAQLSYKDFSGLQNGYTGSYYSFVRLRPESSITMLENKLTADTSMMNSMGGGGIFFVPFEDVYLDKTSRREGSNTFIQRREPTLLVVGMSVALAILLIAAFNYVNITMTRARNRLKNIAGQRIFGASAWSVRWQTVLDTTLLVAISFGLALAFINALLPQFNAFMDSTIMLSDIFSLNNMLFIVSLLLVLIILPSAYILMRIEVSSPMETFKNPMGRSIRISSMMVIAQFVISIVLVAVGLNISRQMNFISSQLPSSASVLRLRNRVDPKPLALEYVDQVKALASVRAVTSCGPLPNMSVSVNGVAMNSMSADDRMLDFYGIQLIEGRNFEASDLSNAVIVNETLLSVMDVKQPAVGEEFEFNGSKNRIIGVVKDFMYEDAHKKIQPLLLSCPEGGESTTEYWFLYLKVSGDAQQRIDELQALWKEMHPNHAGLEIKSVAQIFREMNTSENRLMTIVNIFMVISLLLTALGLFGLSYYTVGRRTREIAIRKIHGSTSTQVVLLLCRTFALWVLIALIIAMPAAYFLSVEWLSTFTYQVPIVAWVFLATVGVVVMVALLTVIFQTLRAASANPAKSIKSE